MRKGKNIYLVTFFKDSGNIYTKYCTRKLQILHSRNVIEHSAIAPYVFPDLLASVEDFRLFSRVAPSDVLNVVDGETDDVSQLLAPTVFVEERLVMTLFASVTVNPSVLKTID